MTRTLSLTLLMLWALVFLGHSWEAGLKLDAHTYAALAKHVVETGDWKTLHYTASAYPDFYQHPPLVIWLQALVYKAFGATDAVTRILPAIFGLGTLTGVAFLGAISGGAWRGFVAAVVLLMSGRYVKFATDFFLDGPLAFFLIWGSIAAFQYGRDKKSGARSWLWIALYGICFAAAALTKGMISLSLPLSVGLWMLWQAFAVEKARSRGVTRYGLFVIAGNLVAVALFSIWLFGFDGLHYLQLYWQESVSSRVGGTGFGERLKPALALLKTYWPWLPVLIYGIYRWSRSPRKDPTLTLALIHALVIFCAFTYVGHYLDHYLVPFYPFAALIVAEPLSAGLRPYQDRIAVGTRWLAIAFAFALAILPIPLHYPRGEPLKSFLGYVEQQCQGQREILITGKAMERWMALAVTLWVTPHQATSVDQPAQPSGPQQLLIYDPAERLPDGWKTVPVPKPFSLRLAEPSTARLCN